MLMIATSSINTKIKIANLPTNLKGLSEARKTATMKMGLMKSAIWNLTKGIASKIEGTVEILTGTTEISTGTVDKTVSRKSTPLLATQQPKIISTHRKLYFPQYHLFISIYNFYLYLWFCHNIISVMCSDYIRISNH